MKVLKILKINFLALIAIPLLLLATCFKLIAKAFEKIPIFLGEGLVLFIVAGMIATLKLPNSMFDLIWHSLLTVIVIGIVLALFGWIFSLISAFVTLVYALIISVLERMYDLTYTAYLHLNTACEADYHLLSLNGKSGLNALLCLFYTLLKGLNWLIIMLISFSIPAAIILSVGFVAFLLIDLNSNVKWVFGMNLLQFTGKCELYSIITGILLFMILAATVIITLLSLAVEWTEWAHELQMTGAEIRNEIARLTNSELLCFSEVSEDAEPYVKYLDILQSHIDRLDSLGEQVQLLLEKNDNSILRNYWTIYMRNLQPLVEEFSGEDGVTVDDLKARVPQIQMLDKQREDVKRTVDKLEKELRDPAGTSVFFSGCDTPEKLEKRFKSLCKTYHPDMAEGDTATFQKMKQEYEIIKSSMPASSGNKEPV